MRAPFDALAEAIRRDILADRPVSKAQECFACGRPFLKIDERFCSTRCREAFDAGMGPFDPNYVRVVTNLPASEWRVVAGPPGVEIGARFYCAKVMAGTLAHSSLSRRKKRRKVKAIRGAKKLPEVAR